MSVSRETDEIQEDAAVKRWKPNSAAKGWTLAIAAVMAATLWGCGGSHTGAGKADASDTGTAPAGNSAGAAANAAATTTITQAESNLAAGGSGKVPAQQQQKAQNSINQLVSAINQIHD